MVSFMASRRDILMGASAALLLHRSKAETGSSFRFIQIADTHFGQNNHTELTIQLAEQIKRLPYHIQCAVHTGDIVHDLILDDAVVQAGKRAMSGLDMPIHYVPGNHDILRENLEHTRVAYEKHYGKLLEVHDYGALVIVTVYTEPLALGFDAAGYHPLKAMEEVLQELHGRSVVVCHHTPCMGNLYNDREHPGWPEPARRTWVDLLNRHEVTAVLTGHFHRDEFYWLGKVPMFVCPPVSISWGRQTAYRIFTFENGRLSYRTQHLAAD